MRLKLDPTSNLARSALSSSDGPVEAHRELIDALYARAGTALFVVVVNSTILFAAFWSVSSRPLLFSWLALTWVITLGRTFLTQRYFKLGRERGDPARWAYLWTATALASGILWGSTGVLFYVPASAPHQMLLLLVLAGMVAGASASASSHLPAFVAFTVPALTPIALRLLADGDRLHSGLAALVLVFGAAMFGVARAGGLVLLESAELRLSNAGLIEGLRQARERLSEANLGLEQRVEVRTRELRDSLERREQFVAVVSHELRTPLTSLKLNQHLLEREVGRVLSPSDRIEVGLVRQVAGVMSRQLLRMSRLVEEMLAASHLSLGGLHYHFETVEVSSLLDDAIEPLAAQIASAGVKVQVRVEGAITASWDRYRIEQVVTNLISNAIKYGKGSPVEVQVRVQDDSVVLEVMDQGPGIAAENLERIFRPFERANQSEAVTGLGLGLYITEQIVKAHGGELRVESTPGVGTTFSVTLPIGGSNP